MDNNTINNPENPVPAISTEDIYYSLNPKKFLMTFIIKKFVHPVSVSKDNDTYNKFGSTYSDANYRGGIAGYLRKLHFEAALDLTSQYFHAANVIDFGCADGPFLPSLSRYFSHVFGIDIDEKELEIASRVIRKMNLDNVKMIHIGDIPRHAPEVPVDLIKTQMNGVDCKILFLLETLEHVGKREKLYESQVTYINELFRLLDEDGVIVISVPKMFGPSFFLQIAGLKLFGVSTTKNCRSFVNLVKATFWIGTEDIEKLWCGNHEGYNYKKLEGHLKENFKIIAKKDVVFQKLYVIRKN